MTFVRIPCARRATAPDRDRDRFADPWERLARLGSERARILGSR
jgi:hypothetical protein